VFLGPRQHVDWRWQGPCAYQSRTTCGVAQTKAGSFLMQGSHQCRQVLGIKILASTSIFRCNLVSLDHWIVLYWSRSRSTCTKAHNSPHDSMTLPSSTTSSSTKKNRNTYVQIHIKTKIIYACRASVWSRPHHVAAGGQCVSSQRDFVRHLPSLPQKRR
jgi:hypothetical protein